MSIDSSNSQDLGAQTQTPVAQPSKSRKKPDPINIQIPHFKRGQTYLDTLDLDNVHMAQPGNDRTRELLDNTSSGRRLIPFSWRGDRIIDVGERPTPNFLVGFEGGDHLDVCLNEIDRVNQDVSPARKESKRQQSIRRGLGEGLCSRPRSVGLASSSSFYISDREEAT